MDRRVISLCLSLSLMLLFAGCAGKTVLPRLAMPFQVGPRLRGRSKPDAIKTVPPERSFDRPSGSVPSNLCARAEHRFRQQCIG